MAHAAGVFQIRLTLEKLLLHVEPWQIFVADNGSSAKEIADTESICEALSDAYRITHAEYIEEGDINFGRSVGRPGVPAPPRAWLTVVHTRDAYPV